jgi:hypothetical protein
MPDPNKCQPLKPGTDIKAVTETGREKKKRIHVYTIRWPKTALKIASALGGSFSGFGGSSSSRGASQATAGNKGEWIYAYTALNHAPTQGTGHCEYLSEGEARALNA